jgi:hypothetical protein
MVGVYWPAIGTDAIVVAALLDRCLVTVMAWHTQTLHSAELVLVTIAMMRHHMIDDARRRHDIPRHAEATARLDLQLTGATPQPSC